MNEYLDADYYRAHNMMLGIDISARVEGIDDQAFWQDVFRKYAKDYNIAFFPYSNELSSGKTAVLEPKNLKNIGKYFILCVDSDYDYLVDNDIFNSPFVFHTYTYSIENYKLSPDGLDSLLKKLICFPTVLDSFSFRDFLYKYSTIIYPIFLYILYFNKNKIQENLVANKNLIKILAFKSEDIPRLLDKGFSECFKQLTENIKNLQKELKVKYPDIDLSEINDILSNKNINTSELFWYIQGHLLYDNVISIILPKLKAYYVHEAGQWFDQQTSNLEQSKNKKKEYKKTTSHINWKTLLSNNYMECLSFGCCQPLQNIEVDIKSWISIISA